MPGLKMASSVYVIGEQTRTDFKYQETEDEIKFFNTDTNKDGIFDGIERLKQIGISDTENFVGNQLAQKEFYLILYLRLLLMQKVNLKNIILDLE